MKILHTVESYWPNICGVQEAVQQISEELVRRGHQVTVATTYRPNRSVLKHNGVLIEQFDVSGRWTRGYRGEIKKYQNFIRSFTGDIMMNYAAQQWSTDLIFPLLSKLAYKKVLVPCGYSELSNWKWWPYFQLLPHYLSRYDQLIYLSDKYQDKNFGDRHKVAKYSVIGNGAKDEEFLLPKIGFKETFGIHTSKMFLCISNYGPGKNQEFVLKAYLSASIEDSTLVFIGSQFNAYSEEVRKLIGNSQKKVVFLEKVSRELTVSAYHEADLFLFGSKLECFPIVIIEAMASKTPFISTDVGCVSQLPGGMIVRSENEMRDAIRRLVESSDEYKELCRVGRRAWEEKYRWSIIAEQFEDLYTKMINS